MSKVCKWTGADSSKRNFKEGEQVLRAGYIIKSGQVFAPEPQTGDANIFSSCMICKSHT